MWHEGWNSHIRPVEVERTTEHSVWIDGRRRARAEYHDTFEGARDAIISAFRVKMDRYNERAAYIARSIREVSAMTTDEATK